MSRGPTSLRMYLTVTAMLIAAGLLFIQPQANNDAAAAAPQGKGGTIKPVPTPTPKKVTPKKSTTSGRGNTNQTAKSKEDEAAATERTYWETIRSSTDPEDFRAYLKRYPNGVYADLANNRIKALEAAKPQPSPIPSPTSTPAATPEPAYEWAKSERDLPAPVRLEWEGQIRGEYKEVTFSVSSGWTRTKREEKQKDGEAYMQVSFRSPDSPQTNISIQFYRPFWAHNLRNGTIEMYASGKDFVDRRRKEYARQNVSARLTETEVLNHPTGHWLTFTADVHDVRALENLVGALDAVYPDDAWKKPYEGANISVLSDSISASNRTRHYYAVREERGTFLVMLYTAPIDKFDEKLLPSIFATLKMSGGKISVSLQSAACFDSSKYEPEILIDGERKGLVTRAGYCPSAEGLVSAGKHHVTVRANEHKTLEKDSLR